MLDSKSAKTYLLAMSLTEYSPKTRPNPVHGQANIFQQQAPERLKIMNIQQQQAYKFVGVKELKSYYERNRKASKERIRDGLNFNMSRTSAFLKKEPALLNKSEILYKIEQKHQKFTNRFTTNLSHQSANSSFICQVSLTQKHQKTAKTGGMNNFSVGKLKKKYQKYQEIWEKKDANNLKGFPSIISMTDEYRIKNALKQQNQLRFKKQNINPRMWSHILREDKELGNIYDKKANSSRKGCKFLNLSGKNKSVAEKNWLDHKDKDGYRFTLFKESGNKENIT